MHNLKIKKFIILFYSFSFIFFKNSPIVKFPLCSICSLTLPKFASLISFQKLKLPLHASIIPFSSNSKSKSLGLILLRFANRLIASQYTVCQLRTPKGCPGPPGLPFLNLPVIGSVNGFLAFFIVFCFDLLVLSFFF